MKDIHWNLSTSTYGKPIWSVGLAGNNLYMISNAVCNADIPDEVK